MLTLVRILQSMRPSLQCGFLCLMIGCLMLLYLLASQQILQEREIEGWPATANRDLKYFIHPENETIILSPSPEVCRNGSSPLFLLVAVCSAMGNFEARQAIRETWGSSANQVADNVKNTQIVFVLGTGDNLTVQAQVEEESDEYNDIIQEDFYDTYNNLTLKSVMMLKWVLQRCPNVLYVMKTDDDTFVNLNNLRKVLQIHQQTIANSFKLPKPLRTKKSMLMGNLFCGARPSFKSGSKGYIARYMFAEKMYPNYLSGSGYVMSRDVVEALYMAALVTPLLYLEDVFLTGLCARQARITPTHHGGFYYGKRPMSACVLGSDQIITTHWMNATELRLAWDLSHRCKKANASTSAATSAHAAVAYLNGRSKRYILSVSLVIVAKSQLLLGSMRL